MDFPFAMILALTRDFDHLETLVMVHPFCRVRDGGGRAFTSNRYRFCFASTWFSFRNSSPVMTAIRKSFAMCCGPLLRISFSFLRACLSRSLLFRNGNAKFQIPIRMSPRILNSSDSRLTSFPISASSYFSGAPGGHRNRSSPDTRNIDTPYLSREPLKPAVALDVCRDVLIGARQAGHIAPSAPSEYDFPTPSASKRRISTRHSFWRSLYT